MVTDFSVVKFMVLLNYISDFLVTAKELDSFQKEKNIKQDLWYQNSICYMYNENIQACPYMELTNGNKTKKNVKNEALPTVCYISCFFPFGQNTSHTSLKVIIQNKMVASQTDVLIV